VSVMPTISAAQRRGLYVLVCNHLSGVDAVWLALHNQKDYAAAGRLGLEFSEDLHLLADLGWDPDDSREVFELTMPARELKEALKRLWEEGKALLSESPDAREVREEEEVLRKCFRLGLEVCEALLPALERGDAS
jgi:hypothetical protein